MRAPAIATSIVDPSTVRVPRYMSPLRYPGGKGKLYSLVRAIFERNALCGGVYVEPYAGGASIALSLLEQGYASRVHINDLDPGVYSFWHSVLFETEELCRLIRNRRVSVAEWDRQRAVQDTPAVHTVVELGFSTFFLNRTNRSGIICSGGMIGGRRQEGEYRLDARFNKQELIGRIENVASFRRRIRLHNEDAAVLLARLMPRLPSRSFVYLDPPYYVKGTRRLYANFYSPRDHVVVAERVARLRTPWLVSYDDQPETRALYRGFRYSRYGLSYTARKRADASEVLFFSRDLRVPRVVDGLEKGTWVTAPSTTRRRTVKREE